MGNVQYRIRFERRRRSDGSSASSAKKEDKKKDNKKGHIKNESRYGKNYWKIWVPAVSAVVVAAVLLAVLIPRPVPCGMTITSLGTCGTIGNDTILIVGGSGFLDIQGNRPVVRYNNQLVPGILEDCFDLNIYRRPGVYNCFTLRLYIPTAELQANTTQNLTIINSAPCNSGLETDLSGLKILSVEILSVEPSIIFFNVTTQVTIYTMGLTSPAKSIVLRYTLTGALFDFTQQPSSNPNQVVIIVQANELPVGYYDILITSQNDTTGCPGILPNGLLVTNATTSFAVYSISPPFVWNNISTPVTIRGAGFRKNTRVFLVSESTVAHEIDTVTFMTHHNITVVLKKGLPVGIYDLLIVNPPPYNQIAFHSNAIKIASTI
jgi:hypothetical protein